jgi:hypothetical protein
MPEDLKPVQDQRAAQANLPGEIPGLLFPLYFHNLCDFKGIGVVF